MHSSFPVCFKLFGSVRGLTKAQEVQAGGWVVVTDITNGRASLSMTQDAKEEHTWPCARAKWTVIDVTTMNIGSAGDGAEVIGSAVPRCNNDVIGSWSILCNFVGLTIPLPLRTCQYTQDYTYVCAQFWLLYIAIWGDVSLGVVLTALP